MLTRREATGAADRRYTLAWHAAVAILAGEPDLAAARRGYNELMHEASARWQREIEAVLAQTQGARLQ
jgi:hypothetical protein